jgi:hypothetical protein
MKELSQRHYRGNPEGFAVVGRQQAHEHADPAPVNQGTDDG